MEVTYSHVTRDFLKQKAWYRSKGTIYDHIIWIATPYLEGMRGNFNTDIEIMILMISQFGPLRDLTLNGVIYAIEGNHIVTAPSVTHTRWDLVSSYPLILTFASVEDAMLAKFFLVP